MQKQKYAFQNINHDNQFRSLTLDRTECRNNYLEYIKRCQTKSTTIKSARVEIIDMVREALRITAYNPNPDENIVSSINMQWEESGKSIAPLDNFVAMVDTSGSMYSEWADVCTVIYGGNFASGGYFKGIKPMLQEGNMTVYETIYGLGNTLPSVAQSGNCASYYQSGQGPRNTALGIAPGDDSGGLRVLPGTVYNGATYSGYSGEDWGPGSN